MLQLEANVISRCARARARGVGRPEVSAISKADAVLPDAFARAGQRGDTLKRVARRGRCRLLFRVGVQHITYLLTYGRVWALKRQRSH